MITKLTENQIGLQSEWAARWIAIALSTEPADRTRAERAVPLIYRAGGLTPPKSIVWFLSPKAMIDAAKGRKDSVRNAVRASVWDSVWNSVGNSVGNSVWDSVGYAVTDAVWDSVRDYSGLFLPPREARWLALCDYFREIVGLRAETEKLVGLIELAQSAGSMMPFKGACYLCERPNKLKPKIVYPDGWTV